MTTVTAVTNKLTIVALSVGHMVGHSTSIVHPTHGHMVSHSTWLVGHYQFTINNLSVNIKPLYTAKKEIKLFVKNLPI